MNYTIQPITLKPISKKSIRSNTLKVRAESSNKTNKSWSVEWIDEFNKKRSESVNETVEIFRKNVQQDLEYIELFEKRKLARINSVLNELKTHSERDLSYVSDLYDLFTQKPEPDSEVSTAEIVVENDDFFEN
tara:strand:+ start:2197 stop:2595 length:399 start_codon:yes stop_codon:yes gene_type:complete